MGIIMGITFSLYPRTGLTASQSFWAMTYSSYGFRILKSKRRPVRKVNRIDSALPSLTTPTLYPYSKALRKTFLGSHDSFILEM